MRVGLVILLGIFMTNNVLYSQKVAGELKKWHTVTLTFDGPECSETDEYNPFLNYRLDVTFEHPETEKSYKVPGYFAADGNAGNTSAVSGNIWKVHFSPDEIGEWRYKVRFVKGEWAAVRFREANKEPSGGYMDSLSGSFNISSSDKVGRDFRAHGRLQYVGKQYLRFAETNKIFYKCGPDAPENLLAYDAFDGDFASDGHKDNLVKTWEAHLQDWKEGDPVWKEGKGKGKELIGAINYLASEGLNSVSFITNNIKGDDRNVFPYIDYDTYDRFDISKLDQWNVVFTHAQQRGIFLHFKTLEAENQGILDNGGIGMNTRLYYRELVARFGHHLALNWNLCEEAGDWAVTGYNKHPGLPLLPENRQTLSKYINRVDAYDHHMVIHNGVWFTSMYGHLSDLTGASLQTHRKDFSSVNQKVKQVLDQSKAAGKIWAVACDEPGDAQQSLMPDDDNPDHFLARTNGLWGAMLAGAWGTEWYFGYRFAHSDLTCQDYRSRDLFWDMGKICINFFGDNSFPVEDMVGNNQLISSEGDFCFAKEGEVYIVLLKKGGESSITINSGGDYKVKWFNPRTGGAMLKGKVKSISGKGQHSLGWPPSDKDKDWVAVIQKVNSKS